MSLPRLASLLLGLGLLLQFEPLLASMRCEGGILSDSETTDSVLRKCGKPDEREVEAPGIDEHGVLLPGAVRVERWRYGPNNGIYWHLRFIDGRLAATRSRRY